MGLQDFYEVFDTLDRSCNGFITTDQLTDYLEELYDGDIPDQAYDHIKQSVQQISNNRNGDRVLKDMFIDVLKEFERRRSIDEQAYWDFQALDYREFGHIFLKDAFLLFREYHGVMFSLNTWKRFLSSRPESNFDVCFDEIRLWLCSLPSDKPSSEKDVKQEENNLELMQQSHEFDECMQLKEWQKNMFPEEEDWEKYSENTKYHADRKLKKWNRYGVEAMLFDDGSDEEITGLHIKHGLELSIEDVMDVIEVKYEKLKNLILTEMARFESADESEESGLLHEMKKKEKKLSISSSYKDKIHELPGARAKVMGSLSALIGHMKNHSDLLEPKIFSQQMKEEGKSDSEIQKVLRKEHELLISGLSGPQSCGVILRELLQRFMLEKEVLIEKVNSGRKRMKAALKEEYGSLIRQIDLIGEEEEFPAAAIATGLAERSAVIPDEQNEYDLDRERFLRLASMRIQQKKGQKHQKSSDGLFEDLNMIDRSDTELLVDLITEVTKKHFFEREAMIQLLYCEEVKDSKMKAKSLLSDERNRRLRILRNQHSSLRESYASNFKPSSDNKIINILQEAIGLYLENTTSQCDQKKNQSKDIMNANVLSLLQQRQEQEFTQKLQLYVEKDSKELIKCLKKENKARVWELYDNIAHLILGTLSLSEDEEVYIRVLQKKYDLLREKLLLSGVKDKYGTAWTRLTAEEKRKDLMDSWLEEKRMRGEGNYEGMEQLLGTSVKILPSLKALLGENKKQFSLRMQSGNSTQDENLDDTFINLLADLVPRFDDEQDSLLHRFRGKRLSGADKKSLLVQMKIEIVSIKMNEDIEISLLTVGLLERIIAALSGRHPKDRKRQEHLAQKRSIYRRECVDNGGVKRMKDEKELPKDGDYTLWQVGYIKELLKKHFEEREKLLNLYQDDDLYELMEIAAGMEDTERQDRLGELLSKRRRLNLELTDTQEENISILEEAAAIQTVVRKLNLEENTSRILSLEELSVMVLTDLQDLQDQELATALNTVCILNMDELKSCYTKEIQDRHNEVYENVLALLTRCSGEISDDKILQTVSEKYLSLTDKYLSSLQKTNVIDKHKYENIFQQISSLWHQEDINGLMRIQNEEGLKCEDIYYLLGIDRKLFWQEVEEQRKNSDLNSNVSSPVIGEPDYSSENTIKPLSVLWERYREERKYCTNKLKGYTSEVLNAQSRQAIFVRLKREIEVARKEKDYIMGMLITGLCERQQFHMFYRLTHDQTRMERLASFYCLNSYEKHPVIKTVSRDEDLTILQQNMMELVDLSHNHERILYRDVLCVDISEQQQQFAALYTEQEKHEHLQSLKIKYYSNNAVKHGRSAAHDSSKDKLFILQEGVVIRREIIRHTLKNQSEKKEIDDDTVDVSFMSQLIGYQLQEAEQYLQTLCDQDEEDLIKLQTKLIADIKNETCENIAEIVFSLKQTDVSLNTEQEMMDALDDKYTALRDKLLLEALMKQAGEKEWQNMSEKERQRKLMELKLKERKLRQEGRYDEAAALLGDLMHNQETIDKLLGTNREEYERKLKERLERRKQRLAEGLSEEECDKLEKEEIEEENKRRNILLEIEHKHDEERDELLRNLQKSKDLQEREKQRQLEIIRLRQEERKTRQEDKFDAAALALSLAEANQEKWQLSKDEERLRQETLAKERIAAARKKRKLGIKNSEVVRPQLEDISDVIRLEEMIIKQTEETQQNERNIFVQLLDDGCDIPERGDAKQISIEERKDKIVELSHLRKLWRGREHHKSCEQMDIYKETVAYRIEEKLNELLDNNDNVTDEDVKISLLAELQQKQSEELVIITENMKNKEIEDLKIIGRKLASKHIEELHDNIAVVLFGEDSQQDDECAEDADQNILHALEQKYDALKDKILAEALMKQIGESEWMHMTEKERQKKLVHLKLKEKKLREEGRIDEAEELFSDLIKNDAEWKRRLGETKDEHQRRVQQRLVRRKELIREREAAGLSVDSETLDEIQDKEEEEKSGVQRRKNILEDLQYCFDEEKAALLASLQKHENARDKERARQLALAKLKREQKLLNKEEKFDTATLVLTLADENEKNRLESLLREKERQRALAIERLNERKKKTTKDSENDAQVLEEELIQKEESSIQQGSVLDAVLNEMDKQHSTEQNVLMQLMDASETDKKNTEKAKKRKTSEDIKTHLLKLEQDRNKWRRQSQMSVSKLNEEKMSEKEKRKHITSVAKARSVQFKLLTEAMIYRIEAEARSLLEKKHELSENEIKEAVSVCLLTDLQEKQKYEAERMQEILQEQEENELLKIKKMQQIAAREGWFDNLTSILFILSESEDESFEELRKTERQFETEIEEEKLEAIEKAKRGAKPGEDIDVAAILKMLEEQHNAKKRAHMDSLEKQREAIYERLKDRQMARMMKDEDENTAFHLVELAGHHSKTISEQLDGEKKRQGNKMQERLEARRHARQHRAEQAKADDSRDSPDNLAAMFDSRQSTLITPSSERSDLSPVPFGLKREKTALNVEVSDDTKQELYTKLVRQQSNLHRKIEQQQSKQEEILQRRLEARKGKRENEAAALFSLGERQKTILQQTQKEEKDRQASMIKERVARVRYERTKTQRDRSRSRGFERLLEEDNSEFTEDEVMERKARELQEKFKAEEQTLKAEKLSGSVVEPGEKLDEKKRFDLLKQKRMERKQQKQKAAHQQD